MKIVAAAGLGLVAALGSAQTQRPPTFRSTVETVAVYARVEDSHGRPILGLTQADFTLLDNGQRREIVTFADADQPTAVGILVDQSGSMTKQMPAVKVAAGAFIDTLRNTDQASLSTLTWDCERLTSDKARLHAALDRGLPGDMGSPIWRALERVMRALDAESGRRALIVLSDGDDTDIVPSANDKISFGDTQPCRRADAFGDVSVSQVVSHARQEGTLVYAVVVPTSAVVKPELGQIASDSGGTSVVLGPNADLKPAFAAIADELRHQYLLGFVPVTFDGKAHSIQVAVKKAGATVRARKSYIAAHAESSGPAADARTFAARPIVGEPASLEIAAAIRDGATGRTLQATCSAAAEFTSIDETRASVRVIAEGPIGRIMRASGEARSKQQGLTESLVPPAMRAAIVTVTAAFAGSSTGAAPLTALRIQSRGVDEPIVLSALTISAPDAGAEPPGPGGLAVAFDLSDFKGLPGAQADVVVSSAAGARRCRLSPADVNALK